MKTSELRALSAEDLQKKVTELRVELTEKKRALHAGELQNPQTIKQVRRSIATTLTLLKQQQAQAAVTKEEE